MNSLTYLKTIARILSSHTGGTELLFGPDIDWESIIAISSRHLVTPALTPALISKGAFDGLEPELKQYLTYIHDLNTQRNNALIQQGTEIARLMNGIGITPVMLKGMGYLFSGLHGDPGVRVVGDIDCLVPENRADEALRCLIGKGYEFLWENGLEDHHHLPPVTREGVQAVVELHIQPIKEDFSELLSSEDLFKQMILIELEDGVVGIPSPTHQALICIEHEGLANRDDDFLRISLRGLHDLACLIARYDINWQEISERFHKAGLAGTLKRYLALTKGLFGISPVSLSVSKRLPLFTQTTVRHPKLRKPLVILSLATRALVEKRIRKAALAYTGRVIRGEESLAAFKRQMANRE